ncbi:MAG: hypothetical protein KAR11_03570 [Phycisphaerae bacterium]|nr:hypothetical protein [Phycisphaerae bacterium]
MIEHLKKHLSKNGSASSGGGGEAESQSFFNANRTTILMALAFVAGLGWVLMSRVGVKPFKQTEVEASNSFFVGMGVREMQMQLPQAGQPLDPEVSKLVKTFYVKTNEKQIPVSQLKKNPFTQYVSEEQKIIAAKQEEDLPVEEVPKTPSQEGLKLQMILMGDDVKSATISGYVMNEGDIINGWKLLQVKHNAVVVEKGGRKCTLERHLRPMVKSATKGK